MRIVREYYIQMTEKEGVILEVFIDGASQGNPGPSGIGAVIIDKTNGRTKTISRYIGETTNNISEYLAFIYSLLEILPLNIKNLTVKSDSQLLIKQLQGEYKVKDKTIKLFFDIADTLIGRFKNITLVQIEREKNIDADRLASSAVTDFLKYRRRGLKKRAGRMVTPNERFLF